MHKFLWRAQLRAKDVAFAHCAKHPNRWVGLMQDMGHVLDLQGWEYGVYTIVERDHDSTSSSEAPGRPGAAPPMYFRYHDFWSKVQWPKDADWVVEGWKIVLAGLQQRKPNMEGVYCYSDTGPQSFSTSR